MTSAADPYPQLSARLQRFVDDVCAGRKYVDAVRRLRPELKRPDCQAARWLRMPGVRAAIEYRQRFPQTTVALELYQLGMSLLRIESSLEKLTASVDELRKSRA